MAINKHNIEWINNYFNNPEMIIQFLNTHNGSIKRYPFGSSGEMIYKITVDGGNTVIGNYILSEDDINDHVMNDIKTFSRQNKIRNTPEYRLYKELRAKYEYTYQFFN